MGEARTLINGHEAEDLSDDDIVKANLQRQMDQTRESISQTVHEIRDTVANQYQQVRESVSEALDWREQFKKRPVAWSVGAISAGVIVGYSVGGLVFDGDDSHDYRYQTTTARYDRVGGQKQTTAAYAADSRPSYSSGYVEEEPAGPSFIDKVTSTGAYQKLESEVSNLGSKFVEQVAIVGREVVLPALMAKLLDLVGIDKSKVNLKDNSANSGSRYEPVQPKSRAATASQGGLVEESNSARGI